MIDVNLNDFYSGGYFLIRAANLDWGDEEKLLPEWQLSFCDHMANKFDESWGWSEAGGKDVVTEFGMPPTKLDEFMAWFKSDYRATIDIFSMFYSVSGVRKFIQQFEINAEQLHIIGTGLHKESVAHSWEEPLDELHNVGVRKRIQQHLPIEVGGRPIGFEVVGFDDHVFLCSWLCNYLHRDMHELFGIRPNEYALIETYAEAKKVLDWINENQPGRAEPGQYDVWLMVDYPLEAGE